MPFHSFIEISPSISAYFWKNTETIEDLYTDVLLKKSSIERLKGMQSIEHRKGFLGVRKLIEYIGYTDFDLFYDQTGKPHLIPETKQKSTAEAIKTNQPIPNIRHISISHSHEFSSICVSTDEKIGVDLEKIKDRVMRIAPRFMDISHLENLTQEEQLKKATIVWGVKEAIFKIKNETGISFPRHINELPFTLNDKEGTAFLTYNNHKECYCFKFYEIENFIFVCATPEK